MSDKCQKCGCDNTLEKHCVHYNRDAASSLAAPPGSASDRAANMCSWAAATLESALLGARKGEIEWALEKSKMAVKTLKRAKVLKTPNEKGQP